MEDTFSELRSFAKVYSFDGNQSAIIFLRELKRLLEQSVLDGRDIGSPEDIMWTLEVQNPKFKSEEMNFGAVEEMISLVGDSIAIRVRPSSN